MQPSDRAIDQRPNNESRWGAAIEPRKLAQVPLDGKRGVTIIHEGQLDQKLFIFAPIDRRRPKQMGRARRATKAESSLGQ